MKYKCYFMTVNMQSSCCSFPSVSSCPSLCRSLLILDKRDQRPYIVLGEIIKLCSNTNHSIVPLLNSNKIIFSARSCHLERLSITLVDV